MMQVPKSNTTLLSSRRLYLRTRFATLNLLLLTVVTIHSYWFAISTIDSCGSGSNLQAEAGAINPPGFSYNNVKGNNIVKQKQRESTGYNGRQQQQQDLNIITSPQKSLQQHTSLATTTDNHHTRLEDAKDGRQFLGAIAVFSAFDWALQPPYYVSHLSYRNFIRNTWMRHPACSDGRFLCYFILGSEPMTHSGWSQIPKGHTGNGNQTYRIDLNNTTNNEFSKLLELEMKEYGDILLLPGKDHYNFGKANEWWKWIVDSERQELFSAKYHWKADAESYLHIDNLLNLMQNQLWSPPHERLLVGSLKKFDNKPVVTRINERQEQEITNLKNFKWAMGWGYGMSRRLIQDIQQCIETHQQNANDTLRLYNKGEHEDVFVGVIIRLCELKVSMQHQNTQVTSMVQILSQGCPTNMTQDVIAIHCGGGFAAKAFQPIPEEIFKRLHDIYYPSTASFGMLQQHQYQQQPQDKQSSSPAGTSVKWAALWHYFMKVHNVCENRKDHFYCGGGKGVKECLP